ncbi:MAG: beta-ketoacyl-ACP synthase III [Candidatus Poribacteria bacterium]
MMFSKILGTGSYLPPQVLTNKDLEQIMDTSDEWIQQRTGIKERHWVDENLFIGTSDLALEAAKKALATAGVEKDQLDMIILATLSPDHEFPGTACFLQAKLDTPGIPALDIRQQCTGFIYGLSVADQFIKTGTYKTILLVGAELHSKGLDKTTNGRDVAVLFGDGAGAIVITAADRINNNEQSHILSTHLHADGRYAKELWVQYPGLAEPGPRVTQKKIKSGGFFPRMNGRMVFTHAVKRIPEALMEAADKNGVKISDIDLFVLHQANARINEMIVKHMNIPTQKVFNTIEMLGNTTAATIPIGLDHAVKANKLRSGMLVAIAAFGSGFTWGSALIRW